MALTGTAKMIRFIQEFMKTIGFDLDLPTRLFGDNKSTNILAVSDTFHDRTKHISARYFVVRHWIKKDLFKIDYVPTE
jgi:hypothetical protein